MIFSKSSEYAIRAMVYLAFHSSPEKKIGIKQLAADLDFPEHFLGKVMQDLAKKHIIKSTKGPNGGFYLTEDAMDISLLSLIDAIDGLEFFNTCGLGLHECNDQKPCPIHNQYQIIKGNLYKLLSEKTIRNMKEDLENGIAFMQFQTKTEQEAGL
jgi:Rrf2 family protein